MIFEHIQQKNIYQPQVFFIENLGYCQPSAARQITFAEALRFETIHQEVYKEYGFDLVAIPKQAVEARAQQILSVCFGGTDD